MDYVTLNMNSKSPMLKYIERYRYLSMLIYENAENWKMYEEYRTAGYDILILWAISEAATKRERDCIKEGIRYEKC